MAVISTNEIVVGYKVVGQAELQKLASSLNTVSDSEQKALDEMRKVNDALKKQSESVKQTAKDTEDGAKKTETAYKNVFGTIKNTQAQVSSFTASLKQAAIAATEAGNKASAGLNTANTAAKSARASADAFATSLGTVKTEATKADTELKKVGQTTQETTGKTNALAGSLKGVGKYIAAAFSVAAIKAFLVETIEVTAQYETLRKSINFTAGDAIKGSEAFAYLTSLSQKLGISILSLAQSYKGFSSSASQAGMSTLQTQKIFTAVSKAISVMGLSSDQAKRTLIALEQMISKGSVSSEELRQQLGDALPGAFGLFAAAIGVSTQQLQKMLQNGEVLAVTTLPKFAKELEKVYGPEVAKGISTINAEQARLSTQWDLFLETLGTKLGPAFKAGLKATAEFLRQMRYNMLTEEEKVKQDAINTKNQTYEAVVAAAEKMSEAELEIAINTSTQLLQAEKAKIQGLESLFTREENRRKWLNELQAKQGREESGPTLAEKRAKEALNAQIEYIATIEGELQALKAVTEEKKIQAKQGEKTNSFTKEQYDLLVKQLQLEKQIAALKIQIANAPGFDREFKLLQNELTFGEKRLALDKRFAAEKIQAAIDNGKLQVVENEKTNVELVRLGREEIKNEMDKIKKQKEANAKFEADKTADQQKSIKKREDLAKDEIDLEKKKAEKIKEIDDNRKKEEEEKRKELREIEIQEAEYTAQIVSTIFNGFMDIRQQRLQNEMTLMQRRYDEEIRLADGNVQKITEIEEKRKQAEREFRIQQFKANQAQAVSNVIFALGPQIIANPKLAPFIIGLAAAQIAVIVAQPVPEFYKGVENFEGGLAKVGERGSELIETKNGTFLSPDKPTLTYLPKGTNVITATKTKERMQMLNSSYRNGQDRFQAVDVTPIAEQISRIPISINNLDERGFTEYVRKGNRTTQILNKRKGL